MCCDLRERAAMTADPALAALLAAVPGAVPGAVELYIRTHREPELSGAEENTAARLADRLAATGLEVTRGVGGHGVVAVLRNGTGPAVMLRTELDALPVRERTGLPYASTVTGCGAAAGGDGSGCDGAGCDGAGGDGSGCDGSGRGAGG